MTVMNTAYTFNSNRAYCVTGLLAVNYVTNITNGGTGVEHSVFMLLKLRIIIFNITQQLQSWKYVMKKIINLVIIEVPSCCTSRGEQSLVGN